MKAKENELKELERKMATLFFNQELKYGAQRAWESPRFKQYELKWEKLTKAMGGVDHTIWDVLA